MILIPERPFDIAEVCRLIQRRHARGRYFAIIVAAEGATPIEGTMETVDGAAWTSSAMPASGASASGSSARSRSARASRRAPRCSATCSGAARPSVRPRAGHAPRVAAIDGASERRWGTMAALKSTRIELVPLEDAIAELRTVPPEDYEAAAAFFG